MRYGGSELHQDLILSIIDLDIVHGDDVQLLQRQWVFRIVQVTYVRENLLRCKHVSSILICDILLPQVFQPELDFAAVSDTVYDGICIDQGCHYY